MTLEMAERLKQEVIRTLKEGFSLPIYAERVPQHTKRPCFSVTVTQGEQKRLLGRRRAAEATVVVTYTAAEDCAAREESLKTADALYERLWIIGSQERFAAGQMHHEMWEDGMIFYATYGYQIILEEEDVKMERLEYNGRKVVGYGEKNEI